MEGKTAMECLEGITKSNTSEFKQVLKYTAVSTILNKFMDVKYELYSRYNNTIEAMHLTPHNLSGLDTLVKKLELEVGLTEGSKVIDVTKETGSSRIEVPWELASCLKLATALDITVEGDAIVFTFNKSLMHGASMYVEQPRGGGRFSINAEIIEGAEFMVQNAFTAYASEGFTFAVRYGDAWISIRPEQKQGQKGVGELYIYMMADGRVYKDLLRKYRTNVDSVLEMYSAT